MSAVRTETEVSAVEDELGNDVEGFTLIELSPRSAVVETVELLLFGKFAVDVNRVGKCTKNGAD